MKVTEEGIEISFFDLNEEAQKEFLRAVGLESSDDGNYDIFPIAVVPVPEE
jgi:hypothetical protein